jgi:hypothetical protein
MGMVVLFFGGSALVMGSMYLLVPAVLKKDQ